MKRSFTKYPSSVQAASETSGAAMRRKKREFENSAKEGAKLLATDGEWELWTPETFEASVYLARKGVSRDDWARWDTAYEGGGDYYFNWFTKKGPLYIFINKSNPKEKYQYHAETNSFYNQYDRQSDFDSFICEHPAFADYFGIECDEDVEACGDIQACDDINASYSIPASNECVPYWQFDKAAIVEPLRELVKKIKDNLSQLGFVTSVGTSGFESVNADVIGVDVDIEVNKDANELSADEINLIEGCGAEFGGKNFDI